MDKRSGRGSRRPKGWNRLDNAAKIFPPTSTRRDPRVFRFACELYAPVQPELLQRALDQTLEQFPFYLSVIKKGLFWHYLEGTDLRPVVRQEAAHPCAPLYNGNRKNLLFSVTYYRCRINLEVYHVLSDGAGAIEFFRMMILHYLTERHRNELEGPMPRLDYDASQSERDKDSFRQYFSPEKVLQPVKIPKAYHIKGDRMPLGEMCVISGVMSSAEVRALAKRRGGTITEVLTAVLIVAIGEGMDLRERRLPVTITVPVNLRQYFPSVSARNFFNVINVGCHLGETIDFDQVLETVRREFKEQLTEDNIRRQMNRLASLEHNLFMKVVPLVLKDPVMGAAFNLTDRQVTAGLSNIGRIIMPEALEPYIRQFDVFNSTKHLQVLIHSYRDRFMVNFTSTFSATDIQRRFFRFLTGLGLDCEITTNWVDPREGEYVL